VQNGVAAGPLGLGNANTFWCRLSGGFRGAGRPLTCGGETEAEEVFAPRGAVRIVHPHPAKRQLCGYGTGVGAATAAKTPSGIQTGAMGFSRAPVSLAGFPQVSSSIS
jgi:hypothetical protein